MKVNWLSIALAAGILLGSGFILGLFLPYHKTPDSKYIHPEIYILEHELHHNNYTNIFNSKRYFEIINVIQQNIPSGNPCTGTNISSFGWRTSPFGSWRDFHSGIDIVAPAGTPIRATAPGQVIYSGWWGGYGYTVIIRHKYGFETLYAHCSYVVVRAGGYLTKGQIIGYVGQTGNSTGTHCHYEIRLTMPIDPVDINSIF